MLSVRHAMHRTALGALAALAVTAGAAGAAAQNAPPAAQPAIHVDDYQTNVWLWTDTHPPVSHYRFTVSTVLFGSNLGAHSMLRVDWKQSGRTLATQSCPLQLDGTTRAEVECQLAQPTLDASGPVSAELRYIDDNTGADVPLRTLNLRVGRYWNWTGMERNRPVHVAVYQIVPNDLLGSSIVRLRAPGDASHFYAPVVFYFYTAQERPGWPAGQATFQCSVDGQRIPTDLTGGSDWIDTAAGGDNIVVDDRRYDTRAHDATTVHYAWTQLRVFPNLRYRTRAWRTNSPPPSPYFDMNSRPGHWVCQLRTNGAAVREFRFTVTPTGIEPHPEQAAANGVFLAPGSFLVDTRFPNPNTFDRIFDPAAIRAGGFFGHAWTQPAAFTEMFGSLPPATGASEPPAPAGAPRAAAAAVAAGGRPAGRRH